MIVRLGPSSLVSLIKFALLAPFITSQKVEIRAIGVRFRVRFEWNLFLYLIFGTWHKPLARPSLGLI